MYNQRNDVMNSQRTDLRTVIKMSCFLSLVFEASRRTICSWFLVTEMIVAASAS